jgi:hypothetical protein
LQIYERIAAGRECGAFQKVISEIAEPGSLNAGAFVYLDWDAFTNDAPSDSVIAKSTLRPLASTQRWLRNVIAKHCPFVQPSLNHGRIWLTAIPPDQTRGSALLDALGNARDAFRALSDPRDRNRLLNAFILTLPRIPGLRHTSDIREYLGEYRQDFGESQVGDDITIGSFVPSEPVSAIADPLREAPPAFVLRHRVPKHHPLAPHSRDSDQLKSGL